MNKLVATFLRQIEAEGLALCVADDIDDLFTLHQAAEEFLQAAPTREFCAHLEPELHIGGVVLRRLSIGARDFFNERPARWFQTDEEWYMRSLFFCLAAGPRPEALWAHDTRDKWMGAVRVWSRRLSASWREMRSAVSRFLAIEKTTEAERPQDGEESSAVRRDYGHLIEMLCSEYGNTPEFWIWGCPEETVDMLWKRLLDRKDAEARAAGRAGRARNPDTPATHKLFRYREIEAKIYEKLRARRG